MGEEVEKERWEMPTKEERDEEELWDFEDLESEYACDETSFSASLCDSISTQSS